jgi:glucosyl-3-phosphoglycerate synthase
VADFFQTGVVTTLHRLQRDGVKRLESELRALRPVSPIGLVLPALYCEFETPAMQRICDQLRESDYLKRVVVAIGKCSQSEYENALKFFQGFRTPVTAIWVEDPKIVALLDELKDRDIAIGEYGKGRTCWLSFGYLLAAGDCEVIAMHDCDILNYEREMVARLAYPVAQPNLSYEFSKAFYARVTNKLHGRVTRLFYSPLVRAIQAMTPEIPYLRYMDSFRYALAGEFAMKTDLARVNRIPSDWGLEVGVLSEVYRNCSLGRICQVEVCDTYDHKHKELSAGDSNHGLRRMTIDIARSLFRSLAQEGVVLGADHFRALEVFYTRFAQDTIRNYHADAMLNGLSFDLNEENQAVSAFALSIRDAAENYLADPLGIPQIPNWNRVVSAIPDFYARLLQATSEMEIIPGPAVRAGSARPRSIQRGRASA